MAERLLSTDEANRFFAERDAHDAETAARVSTRAAGKVYTPAEAAKLRGRGSTASSPDGKPKASNPWRRDKVFLATLAGSLVQHTKAALDAKVAPLVARIAQLEAGQKSPDDVSLAHRDASGNVTAEYWQRGQEVALRISGTTTKQAIAGTPKATALLREFESLAP